METGRVYRVELERLDRGYEARVPAIHGCLCVGLTEHETLRRLKDVIGHCTEANGTTAIQEAIQLEVFRT